MFFFSKKVFLADALAGLIDVHNHLLPGIDDGADSLATTQAMISLYQELGFKGVYTTPHTMEDYYNNDASGITKCFENTRKQLDRSQAALLLGTASEYMLDGGFSQLLKEGNYLKLPDEQLLFEFSYFQKPNNAEELIFEMKSYDLLPVLAHPERYRYLNVPQIIDLKKRGCMLQINLLSLSGHYGTAALKKAEQLLLEDHATMVATDAHRVEHLTKIKDMQVSQKIFQKIKSLNP